MKKRLQLSGLLVLSLFAIAGCNSSNSNNNVATSQNINTVASKTTLSGIVQFPLLPSIEPKRGAGGEFATKATLTDVATNSTVALINPSDNKTIASGLTGSNGAFSINPSATFNPTSGDIFTLDASKRLGGAGNDNISIRTIVKWNGTSFDSITTPSIYINTKTTALAIISSLSPSDITSSATIGTMATVSGASVVANINTPVTAALINTVKGLVETQLTANIDPVSTIEVHSGTYSIHTAPSPSPIPSSSAYTTGCVGEPADCP